MKHIISYLLKLLIDSPITAASTMEFKDRQWGGKFDKNDIYFTIIGGFIGQIIQLIILLILLNNAE